MKLDKTHIINFGLFLIGCGYLFSVWDSPDQTAWITAKSVINVVLIISIGWEVFQYFWRLKRKKPTYFLQALSDILSMWLGSAAGMFLAMLFTRILK